MVSKVARTKTIKVKIDTSECFHGKIAEKKLNVDEILYKEARNNVQALIKDRKRKILQEKLPENIGKPKELWKIIKK